jgi:hypothetical protein
MVPTIGLAHVSPWIATRRSLTLRSSRTFLIGGATALVLMMSGMATPALRANLDTRHSPWTVVGSMVRSKRGNAQVSSCSTDSGWVGSGMPNPFPSSFIRTGLVIWKAGLFQIGWRLVSSYLVLGGHVPPEVGSLQFRIWKLGRQPALVINFQLEQLEKKKFRFWSGPALLETV